MVISPKALLVDHHLTTLFITNHGKSAMRNSG